MTHEGSADNDDNKRRTAVAISGESEADSFLINAIYPFPKITLQAPSHSASFIFMLGHPGFGASLLGGIQHKFPSQRLSDEAGS